jgi:hypothetical protein
VFHRRKSNLEPEPAPAPAQQATPGTGKGRPTPKRREAEAAARARAKAPKTRRERAAQQRQKRAQRSQQMREAMRNGDDRHLPTRDKGPMRRFIRDFVDVRLSFVELLLPVLLLGVVLGWSGNVQAAALANTLMMAMILLVAVDLVILRFRLRRELNRRFPDDPRRGTTFYAITRAMQMKFMRMPKSQVKIGQKLPEHYH